MTTMTRTATLTGSAAHLADQIGWVASHLPTRPALPVLTGMRLTASSEGWASAQGTDYEVWTQADLEVDTDGPIDVVVPGRLLASLLATLPRTLMVTLAVDPDRVRVSCGPARAEIRTLPAEDYPQAPDWLEPVGNMNAQELAQAVARIHSAASTDEMLPMLQGIHLTLSEQGSQFEATDRYRFALATAPWTPTLDSDENAHTALVAARTLHLAAKALARSETVSIGLGEDVLTLSGDGRRLMTRTLDTGGFPTWERTHQLVPEMDTEVIVEIAALLESIKRVSLFAERNTPVRIAISADGLVVRAGGGDVGAAAEDIEATVETDRDFTIHVQSAYLTEALAAIPGQHARLSIGPADKPFLARPGDEVEDGLTWLLMPVRQTGGEEGGL